MSATYLRLPVGKSRDLKVKPYQVNRKSIRRVSDELLKYVLELLAPEESVELVEGVTSVKVDPDIFIKFLAMSR